jgi:uncharacterized membrane protein
MSKFKETIEVGVPVRAAYEQLTQFESYPEFMTGVQQVTQLSETQTHWVMDLDGHRSEFDAQLIECQPDKRVAWKAASGPLLSEAITLKRMGADRCQIVAELEADARAMMPSEAHARLKADLTQFKDYLERQVGPMHAL